jgi:hypothetical protein
VFITALCVVDRCQFTVTVGRRAVSRLSTYGESHPACRRSHHVAGELINIGGNRGITILELAEKIRRMCAGVGDEVPACSLTTSSANASVKMSGGVYQTPTRRSGFLVSRGSIRLKNVLVRPSLGLRRRTLCGEGLGGRRAHGR